MTKSLDFGPVGTEVPVIGPVELTKAALNFDADYRAIEEGLGKIVYTDTTAPTDRPSTLRIAQTGRPNVYAGTGISNTVWLPSTKGVDTVVEIKQVWEITDDTDPSFLLQLPVRAALTLNLPVSAYVDASRVSSLIGRLVAAVAAQGEESINGGVDALLHGIVRKS